MSYSPKHDTDQTAARTSADKPAMDPKKKQKIGVIVLLAVLGVIVIVMLVLILKPSGPNPSPLYPDGVLPTSGTRHEVHVLPNGGKDAMEVNGLWRLDQVTLYEFDGYGRGIMHTAVDDYSFVYSAQDGLLEIDYDTDNGQDTEYTYVIDGDSLTISRGETVYQFTKEI